MSSRGERRAEPRREDEPNAPAPSTLGLMYNSNLCGSCATYCSVVLHGRTVSATSLTDPASRTHPHPARRTLLLWLPLLPSPSNSPILLLPIHQTPLPFLLFSQFHALNPRNEQLRSRSLLIYLRRFFSVHPQC